MGRGIKKQTISTNRISNESVIITELTPQEMQIARIGDEIPLLNGTNFQEGDYVEFTITVNASVGAIVADNAQLNSSIKGTFLTRQTLDSLTINKGEAYFVTNSNIDKVLFAGGILISDKNTLGKIKDNDQASSITMVLLNSTVNDNIRIDSGADSVFVAQSCIFNDNVIFTNKAPSFLCTTDSNFNKKLSVKEALTF